MSPQRPRAAGDGTAAWKGGPKEGGSYLFQNEIVVGRLLKVCSASQLRDTFLAYALAVADATADAVAGSRPLGAPTRRCAEGWRASPCRAARTRPTCPRPRDRATILSLRGWRNAVEIVLLEISNSMKSYASVSHAYTNNIRPVIGLFEPNNIDEVSNRTPPTSHSL